MVTFESGGDDPTTHKVDTVRSNDFVVSVPPVTIDDCSIPSPLGPSATPTAEVTITNPDPQFDDIIVLEHNEDGRWLVTGYKKTTILNGTHDYSLTLQNGVPDFPGTFGTRVSLNYASEGDKVYCTDITVEEMFDSRVVTIPDDACVIESDQTLVFGQQMTVSLPVENPNNAPANVTVGVDWSGIRIGRSAGTISAGSTEYVDVTITAPHRRGTDTPAGVLLDASES